MTSAATSDDWRELPSSASSSVPSNLLFRVLPTKNTTSTTKKASKTADDDDSPRSIQSGDTVLVDIIGRQADNPQHLDGPVFQQAKSWLVTIGEPFSLTRPLESALLQMLEGQTALVYVEATSRYHPFAGVVRKYHTVGGGESSSEPYTVPPHSNLIYEITAIQIVMDTGRLNPYFPIQKALTLKNIANDLYQNEWQLSAKQEEGDAKTASSSRSSSSKNSRERAIYLYEKAAKSMKTLLGGTYFASVEPDHPQRKQCQTIMMDSLNNVIAVYLRAKRWRQAREAAKTALKEDSKNPKTHLRNVKAHVLDPNNASIADETDQAVDKADRVICYKDTEEKEFKQLRATWTKSKSLRS